MWIEATIKVLNPARKGVSSAGKDYKTQDLILEYTELDEHQNPVIDQAGNPVTSRLRATAFNGIVDRLETAQAKQFDTYWFDIRFSTRAFNRTDGTNSVMTDIRIYDMIVNYEQTNQPQQ